MSETMQSESAVSLPSAGPVSAGTVLITLIFCAALR
jgi:hypothetical protein